MWKDYLILQTSEVFILIIRNKQNKWLDRFEKYVAKSFKGDVVLSK